MGPLFKIFDLIGTKLQDESDSRGDLYYNFVIILALRQGLESYHIPLDKGPKSMSSASTKALEHPSVDRVTGSYRVTSTVAKVETGTREELHNLTSMIREFV